MSKSGFLYRCNDCGEVAEAENKFNPNPGDHFLVTCDKCGKKSNNIPACFGLETPWSYIEGFKLIEGNL